MLEAKSGQSRETHDVVLNTRERLSINGVKEIVNFDENSVNVRTSCGDLCIEGEDIHINVLDIERGELQMNGRINGLSYFDAQSDGEKHSLLSRIFK